MIILMILTVCCGFFQFSQAMLSKERSIDCNKQKIVSESKIKTSVKTSDQKIVSADLDIPLSYLVKEINLSGKYSDLALTEYELNCLLSLQSSRQDFGAAVERASRLLNKKNMNKILRVADCLLLDNEIIEPLYYAAAKKQFEDCSFSIKKLVKCTKMCGLDKAYVLGETYCVKSPAMILNDYCSMPLKKDEGEDIKEIRLVNDNNDDGVVILEQIGFSNLMKKFPNVTKVDLSSAKKIYIDSCSSGWFTTIFSGRSLHVKKSAMVNSPAEITMLKEQIIKQQEDNKNMNNLILKTIDTGFSIISTGYNYATLFSSPNNNLSRILTSRLCSCALTESVYHELILSGTRSVNSRLSLLKYSYLTLNMAAFLCKLKYGSILKTQWEKEGMYGMSWNAQIVWND